MLHIMSSLFKTTTKQTEGPDETLIEAAIERAVANTGPLYPRHRTVSETASSTR